MAEAAPAYLFGVLRAVAGCRDAGDLLMLNHTLRHFETSEPAGIYIEVLHKSLSSTFKIYKAQQRKDVINNVEVIVDRNSFWDDDSFQERMRRYVRMSSHGHLKAIRHIATIDSAAAKLLQLAEIVAYGRRLTEGGVTLRLLNERYGIRFT